MNAFDPNYNLALDKHYKVLEARVHKLEFLLMSLHNKQQEMHEYLLTVQSEIKELDVKTQKAKK